MYAKLFSRITESSIIEESITTRWVFVALLAIADPDGTVIGTDVAIARRINVPLSDFEESMNILMSPDTHSNNLEFEGKRVIPSVGERGYFLTGYSRYRSLKTEEDRRNYMKEYMAKRRSNVNSVNSVNIPLAQLTHAEAEAHSNNVCAKNGHLTVVSDGFDMFWKVYPKRKAKADAEKAWKQVNAKEFVDVIITAVEKQKAWPDWRKENGQYIPLPASWLRAKRWFDEATSVKRMDAPI